MFEYFWHRCGSGLALAFALGFPIAIGFVGCLHVTGTAPPGYSESAEVIHNGALGLIVMLLFFLYGYWKPD